MVGGNINLGGSVQPLPKKAVDGDGYTYQTVVIGNQVWMAENLRATKYSNGDIIGTTATPLDTVTYLFQPKYQWPYNGLEINTANFGRLYTWYAATDSRNICPVGFHIPSYNDWDQLIMYLEMNGFGYGGQSFEIAKAVASITGWAPSAIAGTVGNDPATNNASGFNGVPAGIRDTYTNAFAGLANSAFWWSNADIEGQVMAATISFYSGEMYLQGYDKTSGVSIRCVQDSGTGGGTMIPN
jgi:uncharacterized protein (TIGR02145 family)